ncbi:transcriptional regulator [Verrucomicrobia bacterium SCGC AG-212-E04]|nr:transcriptional regulator [Verrucomicrobia bacterium SCGC AG-212-E04]
MQVPLLDLKAQYGPLREAIEARLREVVESQQFILGPAVAAFEEAIRDYCRSAFAIGMSSGTDAQLAILMHLGLGPGDAVVTSPFTFFATAGCVSRVGARPIFCDIEPETFNLSPAAVASYLGHVARRDASGVLRTPTGERIRAIAPVHLFGMCAAMTEFIALGEAYGLPVLEDASQAIGAEYPFGDGRTGVAGSMGEFGWYSFFPSKNLGAFGDAGLAVGRDTRDEAPLRAMRMHGMDAQYFHAFVGGNFRIDALQAAVLSVKLPHLNEWSDARRANALLYRAHFEAAGLVGKIAVPTEPYAKAGLRHHHIYHQYVIRTPQRDELLAHLKSREIGCAIYYPLALHQQKCFAPLGYQAGDFPESERAAKEVLALPVYPELTPAQIAFVVDSIAEFFGRH